MIRPIRSLTRPRRCARSASLTRAGGAGRPACSQLASAAARQRRCDDLPRARELGVDASTSISPASVRRITPPRSTRRSDWTSQCSIPPSSPLQRLRPSPLTTSRSAGLTTQRHAAAIGHTAQRVARDVDHALGLNRRVAPASICSASGSPARRRRARARRRARRAAARPRRARRPARRARAATSLRRRRSPAARPSASPVGACLVADLLGLGPGGSTARRRSPPRALGAGRRAARTRSWPRAPRPLARDQRTSSASPRERTTRAGLLELAHDRRRSGPAPPRRRACAAAAGIPSPRSASGRRARTCSPRIRSLTSSLTPRSASARSFWSASRRIELDRAVVELDDVLEDEQQAADLGGELLVGLAQRVEHVALGRAVGVVEDVGERLDAAGGRVLLLDDARRASARITSSTCLTTSGLVSPIRAIRSAMSAWSDSGRLREHLRGTASCAGWRSRARSSAATRCAGT